MAKLNDDVDVIVIGGGVVGCAVFRRFTLMGAHTMLLEKGTDILSGASKANSAILHTGFDAPTGSLELKCMQAGYHEYMAIHKKMNLPLLKTSAIVVAWTQEQLDTLPGIVQQAHNNGVVDVIQISQSQVYQREPNLAKGALGGVYVPGEYIIDPWSSPLAYVTQAVMHGGKYEFNCEVLDATPDSDGWELTTSKGTIRSRLVINCAGNQGDLVDGMWRIPEFEIHPRKGQFLVYDKAAAAQINAIILPVPTLTTKGVLLCRTIFGNMILGPTAEEQQDRNRADVDETVMKGLIEKGSNMLPTLTDYPVIATYAGLRPATEKKEYRVFHYPQDKWITVGGIRSTGLTAALGIASYVEKLYQESFPALFSLSVPKELKWPVMPMLSDYETRDYACPGNGGVVCHCELVTHRELEAVFNSAVPPECIGGLRRRTRVMMGRCNGFFCSNNVAEIIGERFNNTLIVGKME